jgi:hypothetical protein
MRNDELETLDAFLRDLEQLLYDLWMWIEGYGNRKLLHPAIGCCTQVSLEKRQASLVTMMLVMT